MIVTRGFRFDHPLAVTGTSPSGHGSVPRICSDWASGVGDRFTTVNTSQAIAEQAAEAFALGPVLGTPIAVDEAWSNQVFRISTRSGQYAIKVLTEASNEALNTGRIVEAAAESTGRVPIPTPITTADGAWLVESETDHHPRLLRCHRWVDGTPCSAVPPTAAIARDVGRSLGILHALRLDGGDSSHLSPVELDRWYRAAADATRAHVPWAHQVNDLTPLVEELAERVEQLRDARVPLRLSHDDLDPKNAVIRPDGRVAITDWDYAGPVLPDVELVVAATSFAGGGACADAHLVGTSLSHTETRAGTRRRPTRNAQLSKLGRSTGCSATSKVP